MAKKDVRSFVALECSVCKEKTKKSILNHFVSKNKNNTTEKLELNKYCPVCGKHTKHVEKK